MFWVAWNIFLAVIPVVLAYTIFRLYDKRSSSLVRASMAILGLVWLAFLPNTCYLLTEWRHFLGTLDYANLYSRWQTDSDATLMLLTYTLFYMCYSGIGVFTFALAIRPVACIAKKSGATLWVWAIPLFLLMSVGVYLGLVLRFNSWELINKPGAIWASAVSVLHRPTLAAFVVLFAGFLWIAFIAVDIWIDGLVARWRHHLNRCDTL